MGVTPQDSTEAVEKLILSYHMDSTEAKDIGIKLAQAGTRKRLHYSAKRPLT